MCLCWGTISASVLDGTGGGSVNIDPQFVLLQNSQILANAFFGPGGNISITTNLNRSNLGILLRFEHDNSAIDDSR
jgi:large exoprotein involved in heme utilization and adhesion